MEKRSSARRGAGSHEPTYRICPRCGRAVPGTSAERYCIHDGTWLLSACPLCGAPITTPGTRYCAACGLGLSDLRGRDHG